MAIDPWIYASGAPPAASSPPYRTNRNAQSGQGFAAFLRSSLDQTRADGSQSGAPVKTRTSAGAPVVRGKVDLGESAVLSSAKDFENRESANTATARSGAAVKSDQSTPKTTAPLSPEEEAVLRAVADLQSRSVKTSAAKPKPRLAARQPDAAESPETEESASSAPTQADLESLTKTATSQVGKRYVRGGTSPRSGFDCSGFTNWVYGEAGVDIARNSRSQFQEGTPISRDKLQKGDLVFFGSKKHIHHVGMYLGDGQFIHSTSSGGTVRISSLDNPVWSRSYAGARRVVVQSAAKEGQTQG